MLLRKCFGQEVETSLLFHPVSRAAKWTSATFTHELHMFNMSIPGLPLGIGAQMYRQLCIAITERHVYCVAENFNRHDNVSRNTHKDVAFAWQSGH